MLIPMMPFFTSELTTATLTTYSAGAYDSAGKWIPGTPTTSTISIVYPQPLKANELQMLEDGERIADYVKTYSSALIDTRIGNSDADKITVLGQDYKITQVEDRPIGQFRKIILRRI